MSLHNKYGVPATSRALCAVEFLMSSRFHSCSPVSGSNAISDDFVPIISVPSPVRSCQATFSLSFADHNGPAAWENRGNRIATSAMTGRTRAGRSMAGRGEGDAAILTSSALPWAYASLRRTAVPPRGRSETGPSTLTSILDDPEDQWDEHPGGDAFSTLHAGPELPAHDTHDGCVFKSRIRSLDNPRVGHL